MEMAEILGIWVANLIDGFVTTDLDCLHFVGAVVAVEAGTKDEGERT